MDGKSKFLKKIAVTAASPHDSKMFPDLMDESDRGQAAFGDSAYVGQEETLQKYGLKDEICEKGYRGKPLTDEQREENRTEQEEVVHTVKSGTCLRLYGGSDARADRADDRCSESGHKHLPKMLDLQHVSIRAVRKKRNKITE